MNWILPKKAASEKALEAEKKEKSKNTLIGWIYERARTRVIRILAF